MRRMALMLIVLLALAGCADGVKPKEEETTGNEVRNPVETYSSLDEINKIAGGRLVKPGVMGIDNESFSVIAGKVAQYRFAINGNECCFRFAQAGSDEDISGYYIDAKPAFPSADVEEDIEYASDKDTHLARWFNMDGQYVFTYRSEDLAEDTFRGIVRELSSLTIAKGY